VLPQSVIETYWNVILECMGIFTWKKLKIIYSLQLFHVNLNICIM